MEPEGNAMKRNGLGSGSRIRRGNENGNGHGNRNRNEVMCDRDCVRRRFIHKASNVGTSRSS